MTTATKTRTFATGVNLSESTREKIIAILNARLADTVDLKTQTKHAHWNVKGKQFYQLHLLFDTVAAHLDDQADMIAERITALGGIANGTARQAADSSAIPEYDLHAVSCEDHVKALSQRLAKLVNQARGEIDGTDALGDKATADLFTEIVRDGDKDLWFLEAHLQG